MSDSHSGAEGGGNAPKACCQPPLKTKKKKTHCRNNNMAGDSKEQLLSLRVYNTLQVVSTS